MPLAGDDDDNPLCSYCGRLLVHDEPGSAANVILTPTEGGIDMSMLCSLCMEEIGASEEWDEWVAAHYTKCPKLEQYLKPGLGKGLSIREQFCFGGDLE